MLFSVSASHTASLRTRGRITHIINYISVFSRAKKKLRLKKAKTIFLKFSLKTRIDQDSTTYHSFPPEQSKFTFTTFPHNWLENMPCKIREKGKEIISDWNTTNYVTLFSPLLIFITNFHPFSWFREGGNLI